MMKMRSKRDQRPLLTHEGPVLSDQMPVGQYGEDQPSGTMDTPNGQGKKASWKRLFGKGGGTKRKQDEPDGGRDGSNVTPQETEYSKSSSLPNLQNPEIHQHQASTYSTKNKNDGDTSRQSSGVSDKRDDTIESTRRIPDTNNQVLDISITKKDISQPSSTKSQNRSRSAGRSRSFMRSSKKKSSQDLSSPSSAANSVLVSKQTKRQDQKNANITSKTSTRSNNQDSTVKYIPQQQKTAFFSTTPLSSASMKNGGESAELDVKKILSRPFGREHILMTEQIWVVHVSRAEWDPEDSLWKYRVIIKRREGSKLQEYATCLTLRSLEDFAWLEQSLLTEFFGGLLLPSLSIYLGLPDIFNCQHEIDSQLLSNWLSDTLNGIRGQGEIMFRLKKVDISKSESVEAFLYRSELVRPEETVPNAPHNYDSTTSQQTIVGNIFGDDNSKWNLFPELCYANCVSPSSKSLNEETKKEKKPFSFTWNGKYTQYSNKFPY